MKATGTWPWDPGTPGRGGSRGREKQDLREGLQEALAENRGGVLGW